MFKIPDKWLRHLPLLAFLLLMVTLMGDRMNFQAPVQKSMTPDSHSGHNRETDATPTQTEGSKGMEDHAEGSKGMEHNVEDSQGMAPDPVKQRRMGIYHYNEGNKFLGDGQYDQAIHNYEMALSHDPEIHEVYINLSTVYLKLQNYQRAAQTLETLRAKKPDLPALHYNLACYYSLTQQTELSLNALKKAVDSGDIRVEDLKTDPDLSHVRQTSGYLEWVKTL